MSRQPRYGRKDRRTAEASPQPENSRAGAIMPWAIGLVVFLVYLRTLTPAMQMGDGTELAAAAHVLGVPHPTGYPLYMLLNKLWLVLTIGGDAILRTTLLNSLLMSAAAGVTYLIARDAIVRLWKCPCDKTVLIWAAVVALTTGFLRFHWNNAVVTEVYALEFLLMLLFTRWAQCMDAPSGITRKRLLLLTACVALGLAHHRLSVVMLLPCALAWFVNRRRGSSPGQSGTPWAWGTLIMVGGVALYAYIPLRAWAQPAINWGNAVTWQRFYNHVRGTEYLERGLLRPALGQSYSAGTFSQFVQLQWAHIFTDLVGQFTAITENIRVIPGTQKLFFIGNGFVVILGFAMRVAGLCALWQLWKSGQRFLVMALALIAGQNVLILFVYNILDIRDYFLYPLWAAAFELFALALWGLSKISPDRRLLFGYMALLLPALVLWGNWHRCDRSGDIHAEALSATILSQDKALVPENSILITDDDSETFTTWYRQKVRGDRPDVLSFAGNFVYMPWYSAFFTPQQLQQYRITLAKGVARSADEYAQQLRTAIIDHNISTHPVFTSINDPQVLQSLAGQYTIEPVDAVEVVNPVLSDELTTTVLYRIKQKESTQ